MYRKILKVFLASPSDLQEERKTACEIIEEENKNHAQARGFQFELVGWEDTISQYRRPQEAINRDLDQCDFFVGMVWQRWGTPPREKGHPFSSGFEEEFCRSVEKKEKTGKPDISLLFKTPSNDLLNDPGDQMKKVLDFKKKIIKEKKVLYQEFENVAGFEPKFRSIISRFLNEQILIEAEGRSAEKEETPPNKKEGKRKEGKTRSLLFDKIGIDFIEDFISREDNDENIDASSIARFRLLGNSVFRSGNDHISLGVHDCNLIYKEKRFEELSEREIFCLIRAGLENFKAENAPLWHWLFLSDDPIFNLTFRTLYGSDKVRENSFSVLQLGSFDLSKEEKPHTREELKNLWFSDSTPTNVKISSLVYLKDCGFPDDLAVIENFLDSPETNISNAAVDATIGILSRESITKTLEFIASREDAKIPTDLIHRLFATPSSIPTNLLKKCLRNKTEDFRRAVANELLGRHQLTKDEAELLSQSENAQTRLLGAFALKKLSADFSTEDAKKALIKQKGKATFGFLTPPTSPDYEGQKAFEIYQIENLKDKSQKDLKALAEKETIFDKVAKLAYYTHYFHQSHSHLVLNLQDCFKSFFEKKRQEMENTSVEVGERLTNFLRLEFIQKVSQILCKFGKKQDLEMVRKILDDENIEFNKNAVDFLGAHGNWEDIKRIIKLTNNFSYKGLGLLSWGERNKDYQIAAKAILKLGKKRVADILEMEMPTGLLEQVIYLLKKLQFSSFDDHQLCKLLLHSETPIRKAVALKVVQNLPKSRLRLILKRYISDGETYYYNSVFWLDLGVSLDTPKAQKIARTVLKPR